MAMDAEATGSVRSRHASFVGRQRELERLEQIWMDTRDGRPCFVVIEGEAGIGKTRLAEEFARRVRRGGARTLWGNCVELQEGGLPYAPFRQAFRDTRDDPGLRQALEVAQGELSDLLAHPGELVTADRRRSGRIPMFEGLLRLLHDLATASRPVLLVVEDVHWADHTTLDLLTFLSRNVNSIPMLSVLTYRPQPVRRSAGATDASGRQREQAVRNFLFGHVSGAVTERLRLSAFGEREVAQQIAHLVAGPPRPLDVAEIALRSGGNPLFVEEILTSRQSGDGQLSPSLQQLLRRRVRDLPEEVRNVLDVVAVAGHTVEHDLLRAVADLPRDTLRARLRHAVDADVLVEVRVAEYAFRHALVQEAVYEDLMPDRRRELHRRFADVLVARQSHQLAVPGAVARHWDQAGDLQRALRAYVRAATAAKATFGFADAERFLRRAYELWDQVDDATILTSMSRRHLANKAIDAAISVELPDTVVDIAEDALDRAAEAGDIRAVAFQRSQLGRVRWFMGDVDQALADTLDAAQLIADREPSTEHADVFSLRASLLALNGSYGEAGAIATRALDIAMQTGAPRSYRRALATFGSVRARQGELDAGLRLLNEAEELARLRDDAGEMMSVLLNRGRVYQAYGRWEAARKTYSEGLEAAPKYGMHQSYSWRFHVLAARMAFFRGSWEQAATEIVHARELISGANATLPSLLVATGQFEAAAEFFGSRRSKWRSDGTGTIQVPEVPVEMEVWQRSYAAARQRYESALDDVSGSEEGIPEARLCRVALWAEADAVDAEAFKRAEAMERAQSLHARLLALGAVRPARPDGFGREIAVLAVTGAAELQRVIGAPDPDAWAVVVDEWSALGMPYPVAYATWRQAQALSFHGLDATRAAELRRTALETAEQLGAEPLRDAIAGGTRRAATMPSDEGGLAELTPREREVADLLKRGCTNREIAEALVIAEGTASVHVSNLLRKLGVGSRTQAAAVLLADSGEAD